MHDDLVAELPEKGVDVQLPPGTNMLIVTLALEVIPHLAAGIGVAPIPAFQLVTDMGPIWSINPVIEVKNVLAVAHWR